jgi:hypothetical protein
LSDKRYNGWTNYETWNVALWLDNDEALYTDKRHLLRASVDKEHYTNALREYVHGFADEFGKFGDVNTDELSKVNWDEIADADWEESEEEVE